MNTYPAAHVTTPGHPNNRSLIWELNNQRLTMKKFNTDEALSQTWDKHGGFFAFSEKQFKEHEKPGVTYNNVGYGLICPEDNVDALFKEMDTIHQQKIEWELANNTKRDIIWYELANHECQITRSYDSIVELMAGYGITREEIAGVWPAYWAHCVEHDYF